jgi:F420-non-reducing hydrogenase iron-sulfur subunit
MTIKRMAFMNKLLEFSGINPERLLLKWVSAAEGPRFAEQVSEFTENIRKLGPSPLAKKKGSQTAA